MMTFKNCVKKICLLGCAFSVGMSASASLVPHNTGQPPTQTGAEQAGYPGVLALPPVVNELFCGEWSVGDEKGHPLRQLFPSRTEEEHLKCLDTLMTYLLWRKDQPIQRDEFINEYLRGWTRRDVELFKRLVAVLRVWATREEPGLSGDASKRTILWNKIPVPVPEVTVPVAALLSLASMEALWALRLSDPNTEKFVAENGTEFSIEPHREELKQWLSNTPEQHSVFRTVIEEVEDIFKKDCAISESDWKYFHDCACQLLAAAYGEHVIMNGMILRGAGFSTDQLKNAWVEQPGSDLWTGRHTVEVEYKGGKVRLPYAHGLWGSYYADQSQVEAYIKGENSRNTLYEKVTPEEKANYLLRLRYLLHDLRFQPVSDEPEARKCPRMFLLRGGVFPTLDILRRYYENGEKAIISLLSEDHKVWEAAHKLAQNVRFMEEVGRFDFSPKDGEIAVTFLGKLTGKEFKHKGRETLELILDKGMDGIQELWDFVIKMHSVNRMISLMERASTMFRIPFSAERSDLWKSPDAFRAAVREKNGFDLGELTPEQWQVLELLGYFLWMGNRLTTESEKFHGGDREGLIADFFKGNGVAALDDFAHPDEEMSIGDYRKILEISAEKTTQPTGGDPATGPQEPEYMHTEAMRKIVVFLKRQQITPKMRTVVNFYKGLQSQDDKEAFRELLAGWVDAGFGLMRKVRVLREVFNTDGALDFMRNTRDNAAAWEINPRLADFSSVRTFILNCLSSDKTLGDLKGVLDATGEITDDEYSRVLKMMSPDLTPEMRTVVDFYKGLQFQDDKEAFRELLEERVDAGFGPVRKVRAFREVFNADGALALMRNTRDNAAAWKENPRLADFFSARSFVLNCLSSDKTLGDLRSVLDAASEFVDKPDQLGRVLQIMNQSVERLSSTDTILKALAKGVKEFVENLDYIRAWMDGYGKSDESRKAKEALLAYAQEDFVRDKKRYDLDTGAIQ